VAGGAQGNYPQYHGIFYGAVSNNADPLKKNRCTLRVPQLLGSAVTTWALPLTPMVDPPKVGTLVAVLFTGGDLDNPVYLVVNPAVPIEGNNANVQPVGTTAAAGTSHKVAAADHVHTLANALESTTGNISTVGHAATAGTSTKAARGDHAHDASGVQGLGSSGTNVVTSSQVSGGDTQSEILLLSQSAAGRSGGEIDISAGLVAVTGNITSNNITTAGDASFNGADVFIGNGSSSNINLNPQMVPPATWPLSSDPNSGSSWATGERGYINDLVTAVNGIINSLRAHKLMS
jgi:hypothetical protein